MRSVQLICGLVAVAGCATTDYRPEDRSILDIVDDVHSAKDASNGKCPLSTVAYCTSHLGAAWECICARPEDSSLAIFFGP
jgi:hypothetical protein